MKALSTRMNLPMETYSLNGVLDRCVPKQYHHQARSAITHSEEMKMIIQQDKRRGDCKILGASSLASAELFLRQRGYPILAPFQPEEAQKEMQETMQARKNGKGKVLSGHRQARKAPLQPQPFKIDDAREVTTEELGRIAYGLESRLRGRRNSNSAVIGISDARKIYCVPNSYLARYQNYLGPLSVGDNLSFPRGDFGYSAKKVLGLLRIMLCQRMQNALSFAAARNSAQHAKRASQGLC